MARVTLVTSSDGDWQGLYIDGSCTLQNHSIPLAAALTELAGHSVQFEEHLEVDSEWLGDVGQLPTMLGEIPQKVRKSCRIA